MYTALRSRFVVSSCTTYYILENCHVPVYMFSESVIIKYYYYLLLLLLYRPNMI